jgi:HEAT repeat protein
MMKKIVFVTLFTLIWGTMTNAQQDDRRTVNTRIADLLLKLPAKDSLQLKAYMEEIRSMGETGLATMISMLSPIGEGDNSKLEYAIGGFSFYATHKGRENWRAMGVKAYCQGLADLQDKNNQAFLMVQLEQLGHPDAVPCLQDYLKEETLCDPAARALSNIQSSQSNETLVDALKTIDGPCKIPLVKALARSHYKEAIVVITPLVEDQDQMLRKAALFALAQIADPGSEAVLRKAAEETGFTYDRTEATAAYLTYAGNLLNKGNKKQASEIAKYLIKNADQNDQVQYRSAALDLWVTIKGEASVPDLFAALKSDHKEYRVVALKLASPFLETTLPRWLKRLKRSNAEVQVEIIQMLVSNRAQEALPNILKAIESQDERVKLAAISAAAELGDEQIFGHLLPVMKNGNKVVIEAVKQALYILPGKNLVDKVAEAVPAVPADAKAALIGVLAHRAAHQHWKTVFPYLESSEPVVRMAAFDALKHLTSYENLPELFTLLKKTNQNKEILSVQEAIMAALPGIQEQAVAADMVLNQIGSVPSDRKMYYYGFLADIGGEKSLESLSTAFGNGDVQIQKAALDALSALSGPGVAEVLYRITQNTGQDEFFEQAFNSYISAVSQSSNPEAQKLLLLRKAMESAKTTAQKGQVIGEIGKINTYPALVFAGKFLKDPSLKNEAASAVSNIALSNQEFHGTHVRELLEQVQAIQGASGGYQAAFLQQHLNDLPSGEGFISLFNGKDLSDWKGLVGNPLERAKMDPDTLSHKQAVADEEMRNGWKVQDGVLLFTGKGNNLASVKKYGDFELFVDWKIFDDGHKKGDAGIYLRGTPQVQIWDTSRVESGAQVGSGGLYNNKTHPSIPLKVADNPLGEWNSFHIIMKRDTVTVFLNGELVTDQVVLENYWDRNLPLFPYEQIELQAHGSRVAYRDIYIREISSVEPFELSREEKEAGFKVLFNGTKLDNWTGNTEGYSIKNGNLVILSEEGSGGNLFTKETYGDFVFRFEFRLTPGANNGLGIRAPLGEGGKSYDGIELQILDNTASIYKELKPYQYHGSAYGILPAKRGHLRPVGEWNYQEVIVKGPKIKVVLNGEVILDGDLSDARENGTMDGLEHPGIFREKGHIGFLGHGSEVWFRNIRVRDINP